MAFLFPFTKFPDGPTIILPSKSRTFWNVAVAPKLADPEAENEFACNVLEKIPVAPAIVLVAMTDPPLAPVPYI